MLICSVSDPHFKNADPDPTLYQNADPDPDPDPDPTIFQNADADPDPDPGGQKNADPGKIRGKKMRIQANLG